MKHKHTTILTTCALALPILTAMPTHAQPELTEKPMKILFVLTSHDRKGDTGEPTGYYLSEVTHPHHVLTKAGFIVEYVSPQGGKAPVDGKDLTDPLNKTFLENPANVAAIENTQRPDQVNPAEYAAIFYAGGHGTMWDFADNAKLAEIAGQIYDAGGVVGAVCHGPAGLVNIKTADGKYLIAGKPFAAFTNEEERAVEMDKIVPFLLVDALTARGGIHQSAPTFEAKVVVSDRLITGQNPASATGVGEAIAALLVAAARP